MKYFEIFRHILPYELTHVQVLWTYKVSEGQIDTDV